MEPALIFVLVCVSVLVSVSSLDDALIDLLALGICRTTSPKRAEVEDIPTTGVFVANWREEDVLGRMVEGNLARIPIQNVIFFLGVYPNDVGTRDAALELARKHPNRVRVVVNTLPGPTSKGQMLNEMFRQAFGAVGAPDLIVLHDSEDIIDPRTFAVYAAHAVDHDFIQVPVFSLNSTARSLVAATYMEEFAERHTREMIVRDALGAMIPSAGVGTCVTRRLVEHFIRERGEVLMAGCVTEDYILGVEAKRAGFKSAFTVLSADADDGLDYVATREFFPKELSASIKQKTRWVYGINFEAMRKLGWRGSPLDVYFFMRDRKGMFTNFLPPISLGFMIFGLLGWFDTADMSSETESIFSATVNLNIGFLALRYLVRLHSCRQVYGRLDVFGVALRWPVALYVNTAAVWRAWKTYLGESAFATKPIAWSKTTHELPDDFLTAD